MKSKIVIFPILVLLFMYPTLVLSQLQEEIIFQTEGNSFSPLIGLNGSATVTWTFDDGSTSNELHPYKEYGSAGTRINRLSVDPWTAVSMINIGYDAGDGGSWAIPFIPDQFVSKVENLSLVKDNLEIWCSSYNLLDTLIFDQFISLNTLECYLSYGLRHISLRNLPLLARLCLEDNNLSVLDLSECPVLMDLRGAQNNYPDIRFSESTEEVWHICVRDNPQITNDSLFSGMEKFPDIAELFIWNCNQSGAFRMNQNNATRDILILADGNHYTSLDLRGSLQDEFRYGEVSFTMNNLKSIDLEGCDQIKRIYLYGNGMKCDTVDKILRQIHEFGTAGYYINLSGNEPPTKVGMEYKASLEMRGWIVEVQMNPVIQVYGNGVQVTNGDQTPSVTDSTDFGHVMIGQGMTRQYVITNAGNAPLEGSGSEPYIFLYGGDAPFFTITDSIHFPIPPGGSDTLRISCMPAEKRIYSTQIVMYENDWAHFPFYFTIRATGKIDNRAIIEEYKDVTDEILFLSEGTSFSPLIELNGEAEVLWTFYDGTTSSSLNPEKDYGTAASRMNKLKVTPWNSLQMINIGYDGSDSGGPYPPIPDQHVSYLQNMGLVKDSLKYWCSSYNLLDSLDFSNFINLEAIESYMASTVTRVTLRNTPELRRVCFEDNNLIDFDLSECPMLEDIRGALNDYSTIAFSNSTEEIWHICVRDNPQVTNDSLFAQMDLFPDIAELFIWQTNQSGPFRMSANNATRNILLWANDNHYSSVDLRGSLQDEQGYAEVFFAGNQVHSADVAGCDQIRVLNLSWNGMVSDTVDKILRQADEFGTSGGTIYLEGNGNPTAAGIIYKQNLEGRGWSVYVSGPVITVSGNGNDIPNGDNTPSESDNTAFGTTHIGGHITHAFVIANQGEYPLNLTGDPVVVVSGPDAGRFRVTAMPDPEISAWGGTATLQITFTPSGPGLFLADVSIVHNGVNTTTPYTFSIEGRGNTQVSDTITENGDIACFGSETILTVAGDGSQVIFEEGSDVQLIAYQSIFLLPGFHAVTGSHATAMISTSGTLCNQDDSPAGDQINKDQMASVNFSGETGHEKAVRIFPNPNDGAFTLQVINATGSSELRILNVFGAIVFSETIYGNGEFTYRLKDLRKGLYLVTISTDGSRLIKKMMVN